MIYKDYETFEKFTDSDQYEKWLEDYMSSLYDIDCSHNALSPLPYWIDAYLDGKYHWKTDGIFVQYREGHYEPLDIGDTITIEDQDYTYVDCMSMTGELEIELEDGEYYYIVTTAYLRILKAV